MPTDDSRLAKRIHDINHFGGEEAWGTNYRMNKIQAAAGRVQLSRLDEMNGMRRAAAYRRNALLKGVPEMHSAPYMSRRSTSMYIMFIPYWFNPSGPGKARSDPLGDGEAVWHRMQYHQ